MTTPGLEGSTSPELQRKAIDALRVLAMDAVEAAGSGHPGAPMGLAATGYTLWSSFLSFDPADPSWPDRDRFVMSNGHAGLLHYALLHLTDAGVSLDDLRSFRRWGSRAPGHPERGVTPGVEVTTGPLGQGIANGVGMAIAERMLAARFNRPGLDLIGHTTWIVAGDGDMMEGVSSEAASLAGHLGLSRLTVIYDDNRISIEGSTELAFSEDVAARFGAYGWHLVSVEDGNDVEEIEAALQAAASEQERPSLVAVRTSIAYGSPAKQGSAEAHGAPLGAGEVAATRCNLNWETTEPFEIPQDVYAHYRGIARRGRRRRDQWDETWDRYRRDYPDAAAEFERVLSGRLAHGWENALPTFDTKERVATRKASGKTINAIAPSLPELVGGSADLAPSTNTLIGGAGDIERHGFTGRNFRFGVREHAMGAILNGIAAHGGFRPFGATFLVFSDYMRPSIRLSALMGLPVIYVFTHDSVALGEDGPTHQPIEHLTSLRAIPNLVVLRPADANETAHAWRVALRRTKGPTALVLSRQELPVLPAPGRREMDQGASVVRDGRDVALVATGSEVAVALEAASLLETEGISARVVSMTSTELFDDTCEQGRVRILPGTMPVVAVEAGSTLGWERYADAVIGIDRFGASAPGPEVAAQLGLKAHRVAAEASRLVQHRSGGQHVKAS